MKYLVLTILLALGCAAHVPGQKTILLSENKAEEYKAPIYKRAMKYVHLRASKNGNIRSLSIGSHEFPFWLEIGRIHRGIEPDARKRLNGEKSKKIWGFKINYYYMEPTL